MELALETFRKTARQSPSDPIGIASFKVDEDTYKMLEKLENRLKDEGSRELFHEVHPRELELDMPDKCGEISDCKLRLYLDAESGAGHFHVVAEEQHNGNLIYTEPTMIRMVAL
ncbi:hypothetical protein F0M18_10265 [Pseudohalioglobus sediminis]|uniref:Uncharacterized protein n=1 Tax=Pseudohalioglobus sediminis TaxID=2606449 RepID=A0A5B0WXT9_9GAMM|nr:hypothetical protein [Pseudohalioglobus sediminis]KAA1191902.1 hypothetical protein F0M18_10265 [Pseudohalioglobus sediminis]